MIEVLLKVLELYNLVLLVRVICSWFPVDRNAGWYRFILSLTEPVLEPLRRLIPPIGMMDLSPIAAFLLIQILAQVLANQAYRYY